MKKIKNIIQALRKSGHFVHSLHLYRYTKQAILLASVGIFVAVHMILSFITFRLDLSKGAAYTLSASSKEIIKHLDDPVTITLYTSTNLPARISPVARDIGDLLREYDQVSNNVLFQEVSFNATENTELVQRLAQLGITGIPVREQAQDEVSLTQVYFGITLKANGEEQPIAEPFNRENLEYNITSAIHALTNANNSIIGIIGLEESVTPQADTIGIFKQIISTQFVTQAIPLPDTSVDTFEEVNEPFTIPDTITALLIIDTAENTFNAEVIEAIAAYLETGSAVVFANGISLDNALQAGPQEEGLLALISSYGITVEDNLILSNQAEYVDLSQGGFPLLIPYPYWVWTSDVNTDTNYVGGVSRITVPWGSSLTLKTSDSVRYLAQSSPISWEKREPFNFNPQAITRPDQEDMKAYILAAEVDTSQSGKLAVFGSSRFVQNNFLSRESQNAEFVLNILGNYASDGALNGIRSRAVALYPLPQFTDQVEQAYKYVTILLLPVLFGIYGAVMLWKRNKTS